MKLLFIISFLYFLNGAESIPLSNVLICKGSSRYAYHNRHCQGLSKCGAAIEEISIADAQKLNRKPCNYCYGKDGSSAGQCKATTKKGTRCSRKAEAGGYCRQHK